MSDEERCENCRNTKGELKRGWTNCLYCSEHCETVHVSGVHGSMPGSGNLPRRNWVPHHIGTEISNRWS